MCQNNWNQTQSLATLIPGHKVRLSQKHTKNQKISQILVENVETGSCKLSFWTPNIFASVRE